MRASFAGPSATAPIGAGYVRQITLKGQFFCCSGPGSEAPAVGGGEPERVDVRNIDSKSEPIQPRGRPGVVQPRASATAAT